jgi:Protein of unknown function DUF72
MHLGRYGGLCYSFFFTLPLHSFELCTCILWTCISVISVNITLSLHNLYPKLRSVAAYQNLQYHIGCSGWSYSAWQGPFYHDNLENSKWLSYYSKVFDFVEIDSSFYRTPNAFMVKNWCKKTPDHFRLTAKFPKVITHDKRLKGVEKELELFFSSMVYLEDKTLALL